MSNSSSSGLNKGKGVMEEPPKETTTTMEDDMLKLKLKIRALSLRGKYADLDGVRWTDLDGVRNGKKSKITWSDANIQALDSVDISKWHVAPLEIKRIYMQDALDTLCHKVTPKGVGALLVCAWGLVSCVDSNMSVFPVDSPLKGAKTQASELPSSVLCKSLRGWRFELPPMGDENILKRALKEGSYLCAAILRLVVKEEDNIVKNWNAIKKGYRDFYKCDMIAEITLDKECLRAVRGMLQNRTLMKNTVGAFLLAFQNLKGQDLEMCKMLFEVHMSYTGMHAYRLILQCVAKLRTPIHIFIHLLRDPTTRAALEETNAILSKYEYPQSPEDKATAENAKTWRYARIFDEDVFAELQTKNCIQLAAVLAVIAQKIGVGGSDVTKIRVLASYIEASRTRLDNVAEKVIDYCLARKWEDEQMTTGTN